MMNAEIKTIRLTKTVSGLPFPYGNLTPAEREFITAFVGELFTAVRMNMNYYQLKNGMKVHVYNAADMPG